MKFDHQLLLHPIDLQYQILSEFVRYLILRYETCWWMDRR